MKAEGQTFSARAMTWLCFVLVLGSLAGAAGCKPKIGEDCATSTDCSISGDRLCDVTQPGGYCTVFNCEPNLCPDDAVCVAFSEGTCSTASVSTRFRRTFCMRTCEDNSDCRGGSYQCLDTSHDPSRQVVDVNPSTRRICAIPSSSVTAPPVDPAVCFPADASFDVNRPEAGTGDSSRVETGTEPTSDATDDQETGANDATSEAPDVVPPDDADGQTGVGDAPNEAGDS